VKDIDLVFKHYDSMNNGKMLWVKAVTVCVSCNCALHYLFKMFLFLCARCRYFF